MKAKWSLLVYAVVLGACGGTTTGGTQSDDDIEPNKDASVSDSANEGAANTDASSPTESDGGACPNSVDPFKTGCATANDCTIRSNNVCCGTPLYQGIAVSAVGEYERCFPAPSCAGLGCDEGPGCLADDGLTGDCSVSGVAALGVKCNAGTCESYVIPSDGGSH